MGRTGPGERERTEYAWFGGATASRPSDVEIRRILLDQLREDPFTRRESILVTVEDSLVTLSGVVSSSIARRAAEDDAWSTPGIRDVDNHLRVRLRPADRGGPRAA